MVYRLTSTRLGSASLVTLVPCFRPRVTMSATAILTPGALHEHEIAHIQSRRSREIRVKVYLMISGKIVGLMGMGESEETVLTFPGSFRVVDALAECNTWIRKAQPDERTKKGFFETTLQDGTKMRFIKTAPVRALYHSNWQRAFGEHIMAANDQEYMYGMTTNETPTTEDFREAEQLISLEDIKTPTTPSLSES